MLCKIFILKSLEKLYKTINESISLNGLQTFFTQRALKGKLDIKVNSQSTLNSLEGHLKDTWALRYLRHLDTRALEELEHSKDTWVLEHSRHLGTRHPGTQAIGHLDNQGTEGTLIGRLSIEICSNNQKWLGIELFS